MDHGHLCHRPSDTQNHILTSLTQYRNLAEQKIRSYHKLRNTTSATLTATNKLLLKQAAIYTNLTPTLTNQIQVISNLTDTMLWQAITDLNHHTLALIKSQLQSISKHLTASISYESPEVISLITSFF
jgi:hypothetical protein